MDNKKKMSESIESLPFIRSMLASEEQHNLLHTMLQLRTPDDRWRGTIALPAGSLADLIVTEFERKTDIPLELPFYQLFHLLSGYLLYNNINLHVKLDNKVQIIKPDIWTILLACSGAGKSFTWKQICNLVDDNIIWHSFVGLKSGAAFIETLSEDNNNKLIVRDEFNEFYKQLLNDKSPMADIRDYLLLIYDNQKIERKTKEDHCVVENPALTILGMCVTESFEKSVSDDDLVNGFAQRFSYIIASKDPKRPIANYPIYCLDKSLWKERFAKLIEKIKYNYYIADDDAIDGYIIAFKSLIKYDLDESYLRRLVWKAHKYALIYHILTENGDKQELTAIDYGWAANALYLHLIDLKAVLETHGMSELQQKFKKVCDYCKKCIEKGEKLTFSNIVRYNRCIKNVAEAKALISISEFSSYF